MHDITSPNVTASSLELIQLGDLLLYLQQVQQTDFIGCKRSTLLHRIRKRMQQVGVKHYQEYLDYLKQQPDEATCLLSNLFVKHTCFFRDRLVWNFLEQEVIPQIITNKTPNEPIRIWSAGCASGEETYSLAILLAEALGTEQFQQRIQIYGTDVDANAVLQARRGCYCPQAVAAIPHSLLEQYFEYTVDSYRWRRDLRRSIIFHRHNLIQAPPLPHIDLIVCRNTLKYLAPEAQTQALVRFYFSLQQQGFLLLGQTENLGQRLQQSIFTPIFTSINSKARIFTKVPDASYMLRPLSGTSEHTPTFNNDLKNGIDAKYPSRLANPLQEDLEQQRFQLEMMVHETELLREQVRSLQDELYVQIQYQHELEQELKASNQELNLMSQEIQHWIQTKHIRSTLRRKG